MLSKFTGFVPVYIRPLFCEGKGPFRWIALSGNPEDICKTDELALKPAPARRHSLALVRHGPTERSNFKACPRICWLGQGDRAQAWARR